MGEGAGAEEGEVAGKKRERGRQTDRQTDREFIRFSSVCTAADSSL